MTATLSEFLFEQFKKEQARASSLAEVVKAVSRDSDQALRHLEGDSPNVHNAIVVLRAISSLTRDACKER